MEQARDVRQTDEQGLSSQERAELQRQGAKSAARGEPKASNPMQEPHNLPTATGESDEIWAERTEAWHEGHEAQTKERVEQAGPHADPESGEDHGKV
jgi:hypothetical protein